ncbi:hypothetical protein ACFQ6E_38405 [Streptomyces sp. NPDC056462]|uniref:hypothetical protein n=1 Tax=Streptomyces sp. NPDC056462 TaxID=3345826 RepID=UPI0036CBF9BD
MRDHGTARRVRLRLARQRPGPDRVRSREQAQQSEPQETDPSLSWLRRIKWIHVGAVLGALVGLVGLIFTGVATYYQAAVTNDQLHQSREQAQQAKRSQAMRVFYWVDEAADGHLRLHLGNSSPDPVTGVNVSFGAAVGLTTAVYSDLYVSYELHIPYLPPCSDSVFDSRHWLYISEAQLEDLPKGADLLPGWEKALKPLPTPDDVWVYGLMFSDRDGMPWQRTNTTLEQGDIPDYGHLNGEDQSDHQGWGYIKRTPEVKAAATCIPDQSG